MGSPDRRTPLQFVLADVANLAPSIIIESALFGVLTLLLIFAIITVARQGIATRSRTLMVLAMSIMYAASGIHWSVNIYTFLLEIHNPVAWVALPIETKYRWSVITTIALFYNFWISDIIVMWRAVIVWGWNRRVTVPCALLIVLPAVLAVVNVQTTHATPSKTSFEPNIYGIIALVVSLLSNVLATSLIGIKAWICRSNIQKFFARSERFSTVQDMLILLVESGLLYCTIWGISLICILLDKRDSSFDHAAHTISGAVPQLVGLYPSIIIVLVALQKTHCDHSFTYTPETGSTVLFVTRSRRSVLSTQIEEGNGQSSL